MTIGTLPYFLSQSHDSAPDRLGCVTVPPFSSNLSQILAGGAGLEPISARLWVLCSSIWGSGLTRFSHATLAVVDAFHIIIYSHLNSIMLQEGSAYEA